MLGMIARADNGGLGSQTWEAWRHLGPARTLIVYTAHKSRGLADVDRFHGNQDLEVRYTHGPPTKKDVAWLLDGPDVLFSVETWYTHLLLKAARDAGIRTVLLANPEMHDHDLAGDELYVPTSWRRDLVPGAEVLPAPVDRERLPFRHRSELVTLYHVASPAMLDRNGTQLVLAAAAAMREPCRLRIRGGDQRPGRREKRGVVDVEWLGHYAGPYHEAWPDDVDVLVLPRRFGGLCLPMQEAASLGMPIVTLDVHPQSEWLPAAAMVPAHVEQTAPVKGGSIDIHACVPETLAQRLDELVRNPEIVATLSHCSDAWAKRLSWDELLPEYDARLS